jgi:hypothetical protein
MRGLTDTGYGIDQRAKEMSESDMIRSGCTLVISQNQEV